MRRDLDDLLMRGRGIQRLRRGIERYLCDTSGPWAEEHYDLAHRAFAEAEARLLSVYNEIHKAASNRRSGTDG